MGAPPATEPSVASSQSVNWPVPPPEGFTADDLDRIPDLPPHTELIDGSLGELVQVLTELVGVFLEALIVHSAVCGDVLLEQLVKRAVVESRPPRLGLVLLDGSDLGGCAGETGDEAADRFLGALAGILFVPIAGALAPGSVTSAVLIPGFTAAVIGGMTSLPGAFVGGIAVGLIQRLAEWASGHYSIGDQVIEAIVPGFHNVALVTALLLVLLIRPQGLLGTEA